MKTILVTGTNKGIGLEFARQYLNEGFKVIATCRNLSKLDGLDGLVNSFPDKISIYQMELLDEKSIEDFSLEIKDIPIDIFINNAGLTFGYSRNAKLSNTGISLNKLNTFGYIKSENWLPIFKANCIAPLLLTQLLYRNFLLGNQKKIVFISSKPASITENTGGSMYMSRSSRSALNQVIKSLSVDLIKDGISPSGNYSNGFSGYFWCCHICYFVSIFCRNELCSLTHPTLFAKTFIRFSSWS